MPAVTPLTLLANENAVRADARLAAATKALVESDAALVALRTQMADAAAALAKWQQQDIELRRKLAVAPLPADADHLVDLLEENLVARQQALADADTAADALTAAEAKRARLAAGLAGARDEARAAATARDETQAEADRVAAWRAVVGDSAVAAAVAASQNALAAAPYTTARERLVSILDADPEEPMFDLLTARATEATQAQAAPATRVERARSARRELLAGRDALGSAVRAAGATRAGLLDQLRGLAEDAVRSHEWAMLRLTAVANAPRPTPEEQARLDAYRADAMTAASKESAVREARCALRDKESALDAATLAQIRTDPDVDPQTSPALADARDEVAAARAALDTADAEFAADMRRDIDRWEAALPDQIKQDVVDFLAADDVLHGLADVDIAKQLADLDTAEAELAAMLRAAASADRSAARLDEEYAARVEQARASALVAPARRAAWIRGEGTPR